jgi:hypothetical protein
VKSFAGSRCIEIERADFLRADAIHTCHRLAWWFLCQVRWVGGSTSHIPTLEGRLPPATLRSEPSEGDARNGAPMAAGAAALLNRATADRGCNRA